MLNPFKLAVLQNAEIGSVAKEKLTDLRCVKIDTSAALGERVGDYAAKVANPYLFKVGDIGVKLRFNGEKSFAAALSAAMENGRNYQGEMPCS